MLDNKSFGSADQNGIHILSPNSCASLTPSALFTLHITVTAPTAIKNVAIPTALNSIKEEVRLALDTVVRRGGVVEWGSHGAVELVMFGDIRGGGGALEL